MARSRRDSRQQVDIWPGFVDALSTLLLSIIFLLVVFVLASSSWASCCRAAPRRCSGSRARSRTSARSSGSSRTRPPSCAGPWPGSTATCSRRSSTATLSADLGESEAARAQLQADARYPRPGADAAHARGDAAQAGPGRRRPPSWSATWPRPGRPCGRQGPDRAAAGPADQLRRDIEALQQVRTDLEAQVAELSTSLAPPTRSGSGSWPRSARRATRPARSRRSWPTPSRRPC